MEGLRRFTQDFFGNEFIESEEDRKLIAPCQCKGTMKYVHRGCLNAWRINSGRKDSYFKCEQCFTAYTFRDTPYSRLLSNPWVIRVLAIGVFFFWLCGWFLFVHVVDNISGDLENSTYFMDYSEFYYQQPYGYYRFNPTATNTAATDMVGSTTPTMTEPTKAVQDVFNKEEPKDPNKDIPFFFQTNYHEVLYTLIIVALFDFIVTNPSVVLTTNMLYLLWRCIRSGGFIETAWLAGCISFGLARTFKTFHQSITAALNKYVKIRCILILDLDEDCIMYSQGPFNPTRLKAETQLF